MRYLSWLITLPLILTILCFAIGNRDPSVINLWPFGVQVAMPIFLLVLLPLALGLIAGGLMLWMASLRHRLAARRLGKELAALKLEMAKLRHELDAREAANDIHPTPRPAPRWRLPLPGF